MSADVPERRRIRLVVPDADRRHVLVDGDGQIPSIEITIGSDDTTILAVARDLLPSLGLELAIVDCFLDQSGLESPAVAPSSAIPVLVELEPFADHDARRRLGWSAATVVAPHTVEPGLQALLDDRLATWRGDTEVDRLRPDWAEPGWLTEVSEWIAAALSQAGRPPPEAIVQFRHWGISAVVRVDQGRPPHRQRAWFKAVCEHFGHEPALTQVLADELGARVASVIAIDDGRRWMLLDDLGDAVIRGDPHSHRHEFEHLVAIQRWSLDRLPGLIERGVPRRPLVQLRSEFSAVLDDPVCTELLDFDQRRQAELIDWLAGAIEGVERLAIPEVLVHGDFHPGNIATAADRHVLFDWSDAAIALPFVDIVTWTSWLTEDALADEAVWRSFADAWAGAHWIDGLIANRADVEAVAAVYHTVSYAGIVRNLDRHRRPEHGFGLGHFFGLVTDRFERATRTDPG